MLHKNFSYLFIMFEYGPLAWHSAITMTYRFSSQLRHVDKTHRTFLYRLCCVADGWYGLAGWLVWFGGQPVVGVQRGQMCASYCLLSQAAIHGENMGGGVFA